MGASVPLYTSSISGCMKPGFTHSTYVQTCSSTTGATAVRPMGYQVPGMPVFMVTTRRYAGIYGHSPYQGIGYGSTKIKRDPGARVRTNQKTAPGHVCW